MKKWDVLKSLNFKQIRSLFGWFLKHPIFMLATLKATLKTLNVVNKEFPETHDGHNKANAFRHAFWNVIIAKECYGFSSNIDKVLEWTKTITDWHEEFSPNEKMPRLMDLHNNAFGRKVFLTLKNNSDKEIQEFLILKMKSAVKVKNVSEIDETNNLIFLED